ncbi:MAG TPA: ATP synthase F1 subunit delta [Phycisphaeraceae bacterium]
MTNNGTLVTGSVDVAYAQALFETAQQANRLDEVTAEVEQLAELLSAQPDLWRLLSTRALPASERAGVIQRLFQGRVSDLLYRFLQVINHKDRLPSLQRILQAFSDLVAQHRGVVEVDAYVAQPMEPAQLQRLTQALSQTLGKQVVLHPYTDPDLIGGIKIRIGDRLIDASVATQLKRLKARLVEAGQEKARAVAAQLD